MFIGKWNKSVFLTYLGLVIAVVGMFYALAKNNVEYAFCCLIVAGICGNVIYRQVILHLDII